MTLDLQPLIPSNLKRPKPQNTEYPHPPLELDPQTRFSPPATYLWLVGNGRMVVIVVIIVPHSSIPH